MPFVFYVALALVVLALLPYAVFVLRRFCLACKLNAVCRKNEYVLTPLKPLWWIDTVKSGDCACKIETADTCYAIKIIGTVFRKQHLRFMDDTHFAVRSLRFETHMTAKAVDYAYKEKEPYPFADVATNKPMYPVILLHPAPTTISAKRGDTNGEKAATSSYLTPKQNAPKRDEFLQNGDFTGEGYAYTPKAFLNKL